MTERKTERESEVKRGCRWIQKCTARANEVTEKAGKEGVVEKLGNNTDGGKVRKRIGYEDMRITHVKSLGSLVW